MKSGAIISEDSKYRFQLWRIWDESKPLVLWVMHNPSKADAVESDKTIDKIIRFSKAWGYGGIYVGNLFPYRATKPSEMKKALQETVFPFGENLKYILEMIDKCSLHVLAHGNPVVDYKPNILNHNWHYLKLTKSGNPCHPLYLKEDLMPKIFSSK